MEPRLDSHGMRRWTVFLVAGVLGLAAAPAAAGHAGPHGPAARSALLPPLPPISLKPLPTPRRPPAVPTLLRIVEPAGTTPAPTTAEDHTTVTAEVLSPGNVPVSAAKIDLQAPGSPLPATLANLPIACLRACAPTAAAADVRVSRIGPVPVAGLAEGVNTITVTATLLGGGTLVRTAAIEVRSGRPNLWLDALEVTQGIRDTSVDGRGLYANGSARLAGSLDPGSSNISNSQPPLVQGRPTVVRAYVRTESADPVAGVSGLLFGTQNGAPLPGSPLHPVGPVTARSDRTRLDMEGDAAATLNFVVPPEWAAAATSTSVSSRPRLRVEVNSPSLPAEEQVDECVGCRDGANAIAVLQSFAPGPVELRIIPHPTSSTPNPALPTDQLFTAIPRLYPVAPSHVVVEPYANQIFASGCMSVFTQMYQHFNQFPRLGFHYAVTTADSQCLGVALLQFPVAAGVAGQGVPGALDELVPAQEIGHNLGLIHASCSHGEGTGLEQGCNPSFRHPHGGVGGIGFDAQTMTAITPGEPTDTAPHAHDFMSYGSDTRPGLPLQWVSAQTWIDLRAALSNPALNPGATQSRAAAAAVKVPRLLVTGTVGPGDRATVEGVLAAPAFPAAEGGTGDFELRALTSTGKLVAARSLDSRLDTSHVGEPVPWGASLPSPDLIDRIEIRRGTKLLAERDRSAAAPTVQWTDPPKAAAAAAATGRKTVRWTAGDRDRDRLSYAVDWSRDGGRTWTAIQSGLTGLSSVIDLAALPASPRGRFRVRANDGFNTTGDAAGATLRVPNHRPRALIAAPQGPAVAAAGSAVVLSGAGLDVDDGSVPGRRLHWASDRDGPLGAGASLTAARLSVGTHRITLRAVDSAGAAGAAAARVVVTPGPRDRAAPRIASVRRTGRSFAIRFSEDVVGAGPRSLALLRAGRPVGATVRYDAARRTAVVTPRGRLKRGTRLVLRAGSPISDLGGRRLGAQQVGVAVG